MPRRIDAARKMAVYMPGNAGVTGLFTALYTSEKKSLTDKRRYALIIFACLGKLNFEFNILRKESMMHIGEKIKRMRLHRGLTQEELAARTELSKGFISQLERDLTSPSIATLMDIVEALGSDIASFFNEAAPEKIVYGVEDVFVKEDAEQGSEISWLITNAQKNALEPILVTLAPSGHSGEDDPHEGEEFGYVLSGAVTLEIGEKRHKVRKGESFYFRPTSPHRLLNTGKKPARILWVSTPPSF